MNMRGCTCVLFLNILLKCFIISTNGSVVRNSGPYKSKVLSAYVCKKPTQPVDKNPFIYFDTEIYNTTATNNLMKGNITILRENRNIKIKSKRLLWENGKWNAVFIMNNIGCQGLLMEVMNVGLGLKIDKEKCGFIQGIYVFKDLDSNKHMQNWISEMEYGRYLWKFEIFSQAGSAFCWEFESIITPKIK